MCNVDISKSYGAYIGGVLTALCWVTPACTAEGDLAHTCLLWEESVALPVLGCTVFPWVTDAKMPGLLSWCLVL